MTDEQRQRSAGIDKLNVPRSDDPGRHARRLLGAHPDRDAATRTRATTTCSSAFDAQTGCPVLVNTCFNVRGEPIVCTPEDAYRCFMRTDMDSLVLGPFLLDKSGTAGVEGDEHWQQEFQLD